VAKIDVGKEEIGYLKLWLGIIVISDISLFSWLVTRAGGAGIVLVIAAWAGVVLLGTFGFSIHNRILRRIHDLEDL
jgi:hypothetical protein